MDSTKHIQRLRELLQESSLSSTHEVTVVETMELSGSSRRYFRFLCRDGDSILGAWNSRVEENEAFFSFTKSFRESGIAAPQVFAVSSDRRYYLLQDLGTETAADVVAKHGTESLSVFKTILDVLLDISMITDNVDLGKCHPCSTFDKQAILWDLNHFKYAFLKLADVPFDEASLESDFNALSSALASEKYGFMYRDFQLRNIMWKQGKPHFIDYQGGRRGPYQYDAASLLYSPSSRLNQNQRRELWHYYAQKRGVTDQELVQSTKVFYSAALIRVLQAMGSYGLRGLFQKKPGFAKRIETGVRNIAEILQYLEPPLSEIRRLSKCLLDEFGAREDPDEELGVLAVRIMSFAYKNGIPDDPSTHGGGFVFDCRCLPNPHRVADLRYKSGTHEAVRSYLDVEPTSNAFAAHVQGVVDICLRNHLSRGFTSLCVFFGCTGGQHRSVYHAERMARYIRENFDQNQIDILLSHREATSWRLSSPVTSRRCAFILAAGLGTRLQPLTLDCPKALVEVNGHPLLWHAIRRMERAGFSHVVVNVHHFADKVIEYLQSVAWDVNLIISDERDSLMDTGGALWHARKSILDTGCRSFLVYNVDIFTTLDLQGLVDRHEKSGALATLSIRNRSFQRHFKFDADLQLVGWGNTATGETRISRDLTSSAPFGFSGIHVVSIDMFNHVTERGRFSVVDMYLRLAKDQRILGSLDQSDFWIDVGRLDHLAEAEEWLRSSSDNQ